MIDKVTRARTVPLYRYAMLLVIPCEISPIAAPFLPAPVAAAAAVLPQIAFPPTVPSSALPGKPTSQCPTDRDRDRDHRPSDLDSNSLAADVALLALASSSPLLSSPIRVRVRLPNSPLLLQNLL